MAHENGALICEDGEKFLVACERGGSGKAGSDDGWSRNLSESGCGISRCRGREEGELGTKEKGDGDDRGGADEAASVTSTRCGVQLIETEIAVKSVHFVVRVVRILRSFLRVRASRLSTAFSVRLKSCAISRVERASSYLSWSRCCSSSLSRERA